MNFIFLVDNYPKWNIHKDTSFALMLGAHQKKHKIFLLFEGGIFRKDDKTFFNVQAATPQLNEQLPFKILSSKVLSEDQVDCIFIRTDPPFDLQYLMQTWLLDLVPKYIPIINDPNGIRACNEKIWAMQFKSLIPPTFIGRHKEAILEFINKYKEVIIKPTDGFGGQGIIKTSATTNGLDKQIEYITSNFHKDIIIQKYIKESQDGDKRILLLNGEPLGAVLRVHAANDFRNNFMAGGTAHKSQITAHDKKIIKELAPHLRKLGLYLVGIDIIGKYLTEVNVTSPTCLQEINELENVHLEEKVIGFAEKLVENCKKKNRM